MTLPGRGPKSAKEKLTDAVRSQSVNSADGLIQTRKGQGARPTPTPSDGQNVVTGEANTDFPSLSITFTKPGNGTSRAGGAYSIAFGDLSQADGAQAIGIGRDVHAQGDFSVLIGFAGLAALNAVGLGNAVEAWGDSAVGAGYRAQPHGQFAAAVGRLAHAGGARSAAFGNEASTDTDDEIALGAPGAIVVIKGKMVMADGSGGLHQIVVSTGGALSTVAYP